MEGCGSHNVNDYRARVTQNAKLTERIFWMTFEAPELARSVRAGQCLMVFMPDGSKQLGRPFEAADADPERGEISVCYMLAGEGTEMLSRVKAGEVLKIRGFVGVPYPEGRGAVAAGGGVGAAGFILARKTGAASELYVGMPGRGCEDFAAKIKEICPDAKIFTDDGSFGDGDSMFKVLPRDPGGRDVWCCGPMGFLKAMQRHYVDFPENLYYSLDKRMACGYGGCMGCVVKTSGGLKRVCADQSLFRADEVDLNDY